MPDTDPRAVLLVDNQDSYTGNLFQLIWQQSGVRPALVPHVDVDLAAVARGEYRAVVLGPGPGTPHRPGDVGDGFAVLDAAQVPVLGVCFGLQTMAVALGGRIVAAPRPAHGVIETIRHTGGALFDGVASEFEAVRYHSLVIEEPTALTVTARSGDGLVMAADCPERRWYGVQFHPESIGTPVGPQLVRAFLDLSEGDAR